MVLPEPVDSGDADSASRAADGRLPGRRGQATRARLLECTDDLLRRTPYRVLKVSTSPGWRGRRRPPSTSTSPTWSRPSSCWPSRWRPRAPQLTSLIQGPNWRGRAGWDAAVNLVDGFMDFWEEHRSLLRVVDL